MCIYIHCLRSLNRLFMQDTRKISIDKQENLAGNVYATKEKKKFVGPTAIETREC